MRVLRTVIDRLFPVLGQAYRQYRADRAASLTTASPYGFRIAVPPVETVGAWFCEQITSGKYELEECALFLELLTEATVCIDIGANIGWFTCLAARQGNHVLAFEPLPSNLRFLLQNLAHNDYMGVEVYPLALAREPGVKKMYGAGAIASLQPGWHGASSHQYSLIPATTLDIVASQRLVGMPVLIKMDVEGSEYEVLMGAQATLDIEPKPIWLVEAQLRPNFTRVSNTHFADLFELFWNHGYHAYTGDSHRRSVSPDDVNRWVSNGATDFGSINYLFLARPGLSQAHETQQLEECIVPVPVR